jgi:hypothetical protein
MSEVTQERIISVTKGNEEFVKLTTKLQLFIGTLPP